jgi:hypothetical protein
LIQRAEPHRGVDGLAAEHLVDLALDVAPQVVYLKGKL